MAAKKKTGRGNKKVAKSRSNARKSRSKAAGGADVRKLVLKYNRAWAKADLKALDAVTSEKLEFHNPPPGLRGDKQGMLETARIMHDAFPDQRLEMDHIVTDGQTLACHFKVRGTHQGEFMGIPPTGKRVEIEGLTLVKVRQGKIVEDFTEFDAMGLMRQLGADASASQGILGQQNADPQAELWGAPYRP